MKSIKNHLSLILALFTIIFTVQIFSIVDRSIKSYEEKLKNDYSMIVIANLSLKKETLLHIDSMIEDIEELTPDHILDNIKSEIKDKNFKLLKISLPKFYRVHLNRFPNPSEIEKLTSKIKSLEQVTKVEDFSANHDTTYKLLLLFKKIIDIFSIAVIAVTSLLILKEMSIWQYQHNERMSIMALFGAPVWLRSAVLFRLAIVDAVVSTLLVAGTFFLIIKNGWLESTLRNIDISIEIFSFVDDIPKLLAVALSLSMTLAIMLVVTHKES